MVGPQGLVSAHGGASQRWEELGRRLNRALRKMVWQSPQEMGACRGSANHLAQGVEVSKLAFLLPTGRKSGGRCPSRPCRCQAAPC
jgi:hypothetical protein